MQSSPAAQQVPLQYSRPPSHAWQRPRGLPCFLRQRVAQQSLRLRHTCPGALQVACPAAESCPSTVPRPLASSAPSAARRLPPNARVLVSRSKVVTSMPFSSRSVGGGGEGRV